ncbi:dihydrofolate reductase [Marinobacterium nitratireducens]|uniref:Dihydrofolate reductase n=1 Tax=Marinobacterium nitratireducens TaxID=518897 RepID=A0A918DXT1_9GAMM|nr:dihydrofolate reductase [Marinobacterium nitratireducens]GGO87693.1 dihydrofolate reductase [Marinobacterium nitratireducens]
MRLAIIVAQAQNRVIGIDNKLPWYLPGDLKYFKQVTMGKPVVMGRKTFESIGRALPGRANIVVTRDADWHHEGVQVAPSLDQALELAEAHCEIGGCEEAMVIGGSQVYEQALPRAGRLYLTQVHAAVDGDARFPAIVATEWREVARQDFSAEGPNPYDYSFVVYDRVA